MCSWPCLEEPKGSQTMSELPDYVQDMEDLITGGYDDSEQLLAYAQRALVWQNQALLRQLDELNQQLVNINESLVELWRRVGEK